MNSRKSEHDKDNSDKVAGSSDPAERSPEWANGLKQLYDDVVDEPLPDSFKDLLEQFDAGSDQNGAPGRGGNA